MTQRRKFVTKRIPAASPVAVTDGPIAIACGACQNVPPNRTYKPYTDRFGRRGLICIPCYEGGKETDAEVIGRVVYQMHAIRQARMPKMLGTSDTGVGIASHAG